MSNQNRSTEGGNQHEKQFIANIRRELKNDGWELTGGKKKSGIAILEARRQGNSSLTMIIPANNAEVKDRHLKYLLKLRQNLGPISYT